MIRLRDVSPASRVIVIGGGPSQYKAMDFDYEPGDVVIGTNRCPALLSVDPGIATRISLSCDVPHVKEAVLPPGMLGVYVAADRREPNFPRTSYHVWVPCASSDHWDIGMSYRLRDGLYMGGGAGLAALNLAVFFHPMEIHAFGFDGGGKYDKLLSGTDYAMRKIRHARTHIDFTDHSNRNRG